MEVSVFVQKFSQFEIKHIRLVAFRIQGNGLPAGLDGAGPFLPALRLQNIQPCQLHGLFRGQLLFFQQGDDSLHGFQIRRVEIQGYFRLVQPRLGFQGRILRQSDEICQQFRSLRVHSFSGVMGLFKEDAFPEPGRACGFLDERGGSGGVIGVQGGQVFIEQGVFRRCFRSSAGRFPEKVLRQGVVFFEESQGALLKDEVRGRTGIFGNKTFRLLQAVFIQQNSNGIQGKNLNGQTLGIFGEPFFRHVDGARQVIFFQKKFSHGIHGRRLAGGIPGLYPAVEFFQSLGIGVEDVFIQQNVEGIHQKGGFRFAANERQQAFFRRSGGVRSFLFLKLGTRFLFRLLRIAFLPGYFRLGESQTAQITYFFRIGLVVHNGGEGFYGLVQIPLFAGQLSFYEFGV